MTPIAADCSRGRSWEGGSVWIQRPPGQSQFLRVLEAEFEMGKMPLSLCDLGAGSFKRQELLFLFLFLVSDLSVF